MSKPTTTPKIKRKKSLSSFSSGTLRKFASKSSVSNTDEQQKAQPQNKVSHHNELISAATEEFEFTSEERPYHPVPSIFKNRIAENEPFITCGKVKIDDGEFIWLVLTRHALYEFAMDEEITWNLLEIYLAKGFKESKKHAKFAITFVVVPSNITKHKVLGFGVGEGSWTYLQTKEITAESVTAKVDWIWAINTLKVERWQCLFEVDLEFIPEPEIYQYHYLCGFIYKKKVTMHYLLLTTTKIYYVETRVTHAVIEIIKIKWGLPFEDIANLVTYPHTDNRVLTIAVSKESKLVKSKAVRSEITYVMNSDIEKNDLKFELKRLVKLATKKDIVELHKGATDI